MKRKYFVIVFALLCGLIYGAQFAHAIEPTLAEPILEKVPSRPNAEAGPTEVSVAMWLIDIDSINSAQQNFTVNIYIALQWKDPRLAHGKKDLKRYVASDVWTPRAQIANEIGIVRKTLGDFVDVAGDGTVTYRQRYVGPLSQPLKLHDFPFDQHLFRIHLASMNAKKGEIHFVPAAQWIKQGLQNACGISPDISLPDWTVQSYDARPLNYVVTEDIQSPGYAFEFVAKRDSSYFLWKVFLPLILIVIMSWVAFWIDPKEINTNVAAVMTSMLTLVAYRFTFENYTPKVGYMTRIDKFMMWSTLLVFFSMVQVAINSRLVSRGHHGTAVAIDKWARIVYPIIFLSIMFAAKNF